MMKEQSAFHSIRMLCLVLKVSSSAYYAWLKKSPGKSEQENTSLAESIKVQLIQSRETYGVPRLQKILQTSGKYHGKSQISRLMKQEGLKPKAARRFKVTTNSRHSKPVAENVFGKTVQTSVHPVNGQIKLPTSATLFCLLLLSIQKL